MYKAKLFGFSFAPLFAKVEVTWSDNTKNIINKILYYT